METKERIIVALDTQDVSKAFELVNTLKGQVGGFKIGLEFITALFAQLMMEKDEKKAKQQLDEARSLFGLIGGDLFYDGKWHDIPNTLRGATEAIGILSPKYFNVHASSGLAAISAAAEKKGSSKLLVVTVLTSFDEIDCNLVYGAPSQAKVIQFARDAKLAGADGLICSPQEIAVIRSRPELNTLMLVTPGVRPAGAGKDDQRRTLTPGEAIKAGADALVIGRPITQPPGIGTPLNAVKQIVDGINAI